MSGIMDHLNDLEFDKEMNYLDDQLKETLNKVLDDWIKRGIIKESDKTKFLDTWDNHMFGLFEEIL